MPPLVLAAGRLTATLLVACIAACSRTSCWVTSCGRRRWRRWRLNAKGSEDTIEAIFGPPETRNHCQFTYEKKDLQTCTRYPCTNLLFAKNDTNIWSQKGMAVHLDASPFSSRFTIHSGSNMNNIHILLPAKPQRNLSLNIFPAQAGNLESDTAERIKENFPVIPIPNTTQMLPVPSRGCLHLRCWCTRVPCVLAY